ncbi:MAG TPA: hypothetical protein PLN69_10045 [bacterium]|nr:hypothetical protein [bacterium]
MLAHNDNNTIFVKRTPCGRMIFMKIGGVALWLTDEDFASLATVVRQAFDNMMDSFLAESFSAGRDDDPANEERDRTCEE